jgi:hypothetical protein
VLKRVIAHAYDYSLKSLITQAQEVNQPAAPFFFACFAKQFERIELIHDAAAKLSDRVNNELTSSEQ